MVSSRSEMMMTKEIETLHPQYYRYHLDIPHSPQVSNGSHFLLAMVRTLPPGTEGKGEATAGDAGEEGKATPGAAKEGQWLGDTVVPHT